MERRDFTASVTTPNIFSEDGGGEERGRDVRAEGEEGGKEEEGGERGREGGRERGGNEGDRTETGV